MTLVSRGTLQTAATIAKTTETIMGNEIGCAGYNTITLFYVYVNGDETGLAIYPYIMFETGGAAFQDQDWLSTAGTRTVTANNYKVIASGNYSIELDVSAAEFIKFMQGGSDNDGTPTGTVAAYYTLSN